ncbi:acyltransferase family protein [Paenibacillus aestuarii]|uniref:Acyltransferase family protein n=1 Tax=Paenibacillus aestuarii TaxID=516965 RepID=A0ABW0KHV5_9BACL|nr:acyltransferase family protein [Paenibacillus aestuarii]
MRQRDQVIDVFKGLLVLGMVYTHILQFFCHFDKHHLAEVFQNYVNIITFSGFVFSFGFVCQKAYYNKSFQAASGKMALNGLKTLVAFYISGSYFRILIDNKRFEWDTFRQILILQDIPGWSEFLISFTLYIFVGLVFFKPFQLLVEKKWVFWLVLALCLVTTYMNYSKITINQIGLLIGTKQFASFPIVQYMPFYLIGMYLARYGVKSHLGILIGATVSTVVAAVFFMKKGKLPGRFPPSLEWILAPSLFLYIYYLAARRFEFVSYLRKPLTFLGRNVLIYLLLSNIFIFTLKSNQRALELTPAQCLILAVLNFAIIGYFISIITNGKPKQTEVVVRELHS